MTKKKVVKKPVKRVKKPLTLRQTLDVIDNVLAKRDETARALWNVLTALRGPDSKDWKEKHRTTVPIRRVALPKTAEIEGAGEYLADFSPDTKYIEPVLIYGHFENHIRNAAEALEIKSE